MSSRLFAFWWRECDSSARVLARPVGLTDVHHELAYCAIRQISSYNQLYSTILSPSLLRPFLTISLSFSALHILLVFGLTIVFSHVLLLLLLLIFAASVAARLG